MAMLKIYQMSSEKFERRYFIFRLRDAEYRRFEKVHYFISKKNEDLDVYIDRRQ